MSDSFTYSSMPSFSPRISGLRERASREERKTFLSVLGNAAESVSLKLLHLERNKLLICRHAASSTHSGAGGTKYEYPRPAAGPATLSESRTAG